MSIIVNGIKFPTIPGLSENQSEVFCWEDPSPKLKYITDKNPRTRQVRAIVCHTTPGDRFTLKPGRYANDNAALANARYQTNTDRDVSWDWTVSGTGKVFVQNDVAKFYSWQGGNVNPISVGFEMVQVKETDGLHLYEEQIKSAVLACDFYTYMLGIPRQIPWNKTEDKPDRRVFPRASSTAGTGGQDMCGVYGHRNITSNKPWVDPGDDIFYALRDAGYELFDFTKNEDLDTWKKRQLQVGLSGKDVDGLPLKGTRSKVESILHKPRGLWVVRPMDATLAQWIKGTSIEQL